MPQRERESILHSTHTKWKIDYGNFPALPDWESTTPGSGNIPCTRHNLRPPHLCVQLPSVSRARRTGAATALSSLKFTNTAFKSSEKSVVKLKITHCVTQYPIRLTLV